MLATPEALSTAPSKYESVCAVINTFSSVMPGSTPQILAALMPETISTANVRVTTGAVPDSMACRSRTPSSWPMVRPGMVMSPVRAIWLVTLPGMSRAINTAAAPAF